MKILQIINSSKPEGGGPIESICQAAKALARNGHDVEMVCLDPPDSPWLKQFAFDVHAVGPASQGYRFCRDLLPWLLANLNRYDCALMNGIWLYPSRALRQAAGKTGVPYFVYTHGMMDPGFKKLFPARHLKKLLYWKLIEHRVIRDARAVFFTCEEEQLLARQSFGPFECTAAIVPYCVGAPPADHGEQLSAFFAAFPDLKGRRLILFLSRVHPKKGCDLLVEAFARNAGPDPSLHLVIAGPDEQDTRARLEARARDLGIEKRLTWTGMLSGPLKWGAFRAADAFALPSHQENFGIAVVEALACGVPVLISDRINIWREIQSAGAGLVETDTADGAAHLLARWLALSPEERNAMRKHADACFAKHFRSEEAADLLVSTLRKFGVKQ